MLIPLWDIVWQCDLAYNTNKQFTLSSRVLSTKTCHMTVFMWISCEKEVLFHCDTLSFFITGTSFRLYWYSKLGCNACLYWYGGLDQPLPPLVAVLPMFWSFTSVIVNSLPLVYCFTLIPYSFHSTNDDLSTWLFGFLHSPSVTTPCVRLCVTHVSGWTSHHLCIGLDFMSSSDGV